MQILLKTSTKNKTLTIKRKGAIPKFGIAPFYIHLYLTTPLISEQYLILPIEKVQSELVHHSLHLFQNYF